MADALRLAMPWAAVLGLLALAACGPALPPTDTVDCQTPIGGSGNMSRQSRCISNDGQVASDRATIIPRRAP